MLTLKLAMRNVVRIPKQTLLNLFIILLTAASVTAGFSVYASTEKALSDLSENYTFVASLVYKKAVSSVTKRIKSIIGAEDRYMGLNEFYQCFDGADILGYNISFADDILFIPAEEYLREFMHDGAEHDYIFNDISDTTVASTGNLYLEREFFSGENRFVAGGDFSDAAYHGEAQEIIVSKRFADAHGLDVGDRICYRIDTRKYNIVRTSNMLKAYVVGIYDSEETQPNKVYITAEMLLRNGVISHQSFAEKNGLAIGRADFVLRSRDAIDGFMLNAVENGLDTSSFDITFNNAGYDTIYKGLTDVRTVVVTVTAIIAAASLGILVSFIIYFRMTRTKESDVLRALGMKKASVGLMFLAELLAVAMIAVPVGIIAGKGFSGILCRYADEKNERNIAGLAYIGGNSDNDDSVMPLVCNVKLSLSAGTMEISGGGYKRYAPIDLGDGGAAIHLVTIKNTNAGNFIEAKTTVYSDYRLAVTDDPAPFITEDHWDELVAARKTSLATRAVYALRDSGYEIGQKLFSNASDYYPEYSRLRASLQPLTYMVAGYCDGIDIPADAVLVSTEDFEKSENKIFLAFLPRCDMVIPANEK